MTHNAPTTRHRRNIPRNTNRSSTSTTGTTRALIERSRSANSRNFQVISNRDSGSSTSIKGSSATAKRGVFTKANERKKRNTASKSGLNRTNIKTVNGASTNESKNNEEILDDEASKVEFIDINNVNDIMDDKCLTETSIDDEMVGNVEFIGCSPKHESFLNDEFNFIQTLPRSYKVQGSRKDTNDTENQYRSNQERGLTEGNECDDNPFSRFDNTKSVKSILTVQEKLTQDFPSLPPQVYLKFNLKFEYTSSRNYSIKILIILY